MPTYDYACDSCGHSFEAVQKMADTPLSSCPECGKKVRRILSGGIGIVFKGSGFYVNDSATKTSKSTKSEKPANSIASSKAVSE